MMTDMEESIEKMRRQTELTGLATDRLLIGSIIAGVLFSLAMNLWELFWP